MTSHYRIRNKWFDYNEALVNRGNLTLWVEADIISDWKNTKKTGKRGASEKYSDFDRWVVLPGRKRVATIVVRSVKLGCTT